MMMMEQTMELRRCPAGVRARRRQQDLNTVLEALATMGTIALFVALALLILCAA